ncbi:hypothetical protein KKA85_06415 [bacterium]|nr:hypothetical protein [bacterium]MBU1675400.1 hypothetical protein [bacterium]
MREIDVAADPAVEDMRYQLVGHREIPGYGKGNEHNSWSVIKTIYMNNPE